MTKRAQETTPASAPPGVPAKSQISWGGHAPGCLGQRRCEGLPPTATKVRQLGEEDWATYRRVRLDALKEAPYAFGSTYAGEKDRTEADWRKAVGARTRFVAEVDGAIVGTVSIADSSYGGAADVTAMWVDPRSRGVGVGDLLIRTVVDWAKKQGLAQIFLWVANGNDHAEALYARNGFVRTGEATTNEHGKLEFEMKKQL